MSNNNMSYHFVLITLAISAGLSKCDNDINPLSDEFIELINANKSSWRAGRNFQKDTPLEYLKILMGTLKDNNTDPPDVIEYEPDSNLDLPKTFDARLKWANCPTLNDIRDQGSCGSCWAVAAASSMTDRICVNSRGQRNFYFSDSDILTCCTGGCGDGCNGGALMESWKYYKRVGVVSGGPYNSENGCRPYYFEPCDHHVAENRIKCGKRVVTPFCLTLCRTKYATEYTKDKLKGATGPYKYKTIKAAQADLLKFGPITSSFCVYQDFVNYKDGVYKHVAGKYIGGHSVKIIGWGNENGEDYWLVANSWNTDWGDKGFFKILRGVNHLGIEENMVAGR